MHKRTKQTVVLLLILHLIALILLFPLTTTFNLYDSREPDTTMHPPPHPRFVIRPDLRTGRDVRVMVSVVSTQMTMAACMNVASGYLSGIPVHIVGYNPSAKHNHIHKTQWTLEAARKIGLTAADVIIFLDSDTVFTGPEQFLAVVDGFIAESAASPDELDARAVREGRVRAPMIVSRESFCFAPQSLGSKDTCEKAFNATNEEYNEYAKVKGIKQYVKQFSYMNSGTYIVRLWALEEFAQSLSKYMAARPKNRQKKPWTSDQAIFNALYLDLRSWEVSQDALTVHHKAAFATPRSQYGLRAGLLEVDERRDLANVWSWKECVISNEFWLEDPNTEVALTESPFAVNFDAFTAQIYNQYKQPLHRYPLPPTDRSISLSSSAHQFFGHAAPPTAVTDHGGNVLLATVPRRVAPAILHDASRGLQYLSDFLISVPIKGGNDTETLSLVNSKFPRTANKVPHLSWYIPLKYNFYEDG